MRVAVGTGVSGGDRNVSGDGVGSGGEVGKLVGDGVSRGDSKSGVGWWGKSDATGGVGDAVWIDSPVDVGVGRGDVNAGVVKFRVSDRGFGVGGNVGGEVGVGIAITSKVEALTNVEVGDGETKGVTCRSATSVRAGVGLELASRAHPLTKAERQMIIKAAFLH